MPLPETGIIEDQQIWGRRESEFGVPEGHAGSSVEKVLGYVGPELKGEAQPGHRVLEVISIWLVVV